MSFDPLQEARYIVGETEFYAFDLGTHIEYYTTNRKKTTAFGQVWLPLPVRRSGFDSDQSASPQKIKLLMPVKPSFVSLVTESGLDVIKLTIARGFGRNYAADYRNPWWVGWLKDITVGTRTIVGNLESVETFFNDPVPKVKHQVGCNNSHFGPTCGLVPAAHQISRFVTDIQFGGRLVIVGGAVPTNGVYTLGQMRLNGSSTLWRHVLQQAGLQFVLQIPILGLKIGDAVDILPGCKKDGETCHIKYGNLANFVGMPYPPAINPVINGF